MHDGCRRFDVGQHTAKQNHNEVANMKHLNRLATAYVDSVRAYGDVVSPLRDANIAAQQRCKNRVVNAELKLEQAMKSTKINVLRHHALKAVRDASGNMRHYTANAMR